MTIAQANDCGLPEDICQAIKITPEEWDVVILGDGSGSRYGWPGGWAAVLFDKASGLRKFFYGAVNDTTVNVMELTPYVYSMLWYTRGPGKNLQRKIREETPVGIAPRLLSAHIITDCEIIASQGSGRIARETNLPLWRTIEAFERLGYVFTWHWVARDLLAANRLCDHMSKQMRKATMSIQLPDAYDDSPPTPEVLTTT